MSQGTEDPYNDPQWPTDWRGLPLGCSGGMTGICGGYPYSTFGYPMGYCLKYTGYRQTAGGCCWTTTVGRCCR
jgi:hypothetical protein